MVCVVVRSSYQITVIRNQQVACSSHVSSSKKKDTLKGRLLIRTSWKTIKKPIERSTKIHRLLRKAITCGFFAFRYSFPLSSVVICVATGGADHERTVERIIRQLLRKVLSTAAQGWDRALPPCAHRKVGQARVKTGVADNWLQRPDCWRSVYRQLYLRLPFGMETEPGIEYVRRRAFCFD